MNTFSEQEQAAVSAISTIMQQGINHEKRGRDEDGPDAAGGMRPAKMARPVPAETTTVPAVRPTPATRELLPAPYFYYRDHSMEADPDPLTPLTPPGRVPNFPAKMHAILSRKDFADIVAWLPHGRSWRVLKPREFEIKVIPKFFEHAKFSSFVRQANGWGFRRITQGKDRNSYYHENFLRGLPHLCKTMKRPGVNEKKQADPDHEPDFYKISEENPLPDKADDDSILLHCTVQGGPKARMPIYWGSTMAAATTAAAVPSIVEKAPVAVEVAPKDQMALQSFQQAMAASEQQVVNQQQQSSPSPMKVSPPVPAKPVVTTLPSFLALPATTATAAPVATTPGNHFAALAAANQMALPLPLPAMNATAASQFAAGFAAATAFTQQHFNNVFSTMAAAQQQQQQSVQQPTQQQ